jgi:Gas vesicle synthesis protein GvpL/GvpF
MSEPALHLYAITDRPEAELPDVAGLDDAPLFAVRHDGLAAVCSWAEGVEATPPALWRHEAVAETLMTDRSVLPARFGIAFSDKARLQAELVRREDALAGSLRRVAGCVELGLRVLAEPQAEPSGDAPAGQTGRVYLTTRLEARRRAETLAAEIHGPLARLAEAARERVLLTERLPLSAAYLVRRELVDAFRSEVERLAAERPDIRLLCTGPWPPYSFAAMDEGAT